MDRPLGRRPLHFTEHLLATKFVRATRVTVALATRHPDDPADTRTSLRIGSRSLITRSVSHDKTAQPCMPHDCKRPAQRA